jgi:hypothetical protein
MPWTNIRPSLGSTSNIFVGSCLLEQDEATRQRIVQLLAEEEAKLAALNDPPAGKKEEG